MRKVQGVAWVCEYSGKDGTWKVWRTAVVYQKSRRRLEVTQ